MSDSIDILDSEIQADDARRWSHPEVGVSLAVVAVVISLGVGYLGYGSSLKTAEKYCRKLYITKAEMLSSEVKMHKETSDVEMLKVIDRLWLGFGDRPADEFMRVVDEDSRVIYHSTDPEALDTFVGDDMINWNEDRLASTMSELVQVKTHYVGAGRYLPNSDNVQVAVFVKMPDRDWVISVHRNKDLLSKEMTDNYEGLIAGFLVVTVLLVPLSFALIYISFWYSQRKREQAEQNASVLRKRVEQGKRMESLGILAGGVAHDINNSMSPMQVLPKILIDEIKGAPDKDSINLEHVVEDLTMIEAAAKKTEEIVSNLMTFNRGIKQIHDALNVNNVIQAYAQSYELGMMKKRSAKVTFEVNLDPGVLPISGSRTGIMRMVTNLINNGFDALTSVNASDHASLTVTTSNIVLAESISGYELVKPGEYVLIEVADSGPGIREDDIQRIFEPFYSGKALTDKKGTGLGLAVVYGVVKDHNAFIDVKSELGKGTAFSIYIPVYREDAEPVPNLV